MNNEIYQPKCGRLVDINFNVFTALFPSRHRDDRLSRQVTEFVTFLGERFVKLEGFDDRWFNVRHVQPHYAVGDTVHFKREYWARHFAYLLPSEMGKRYFSLSALLQLEATPECNVTSSMPFVIEKIVYDCDDCSEDHISLKEFDRDVFSAHDVVSHDEPDGPWTPGETVQIDDPEQHIRGIYAIYDCSAGEIVIAAHEDSGISRKYFRKYFVNVDCIVRCIPRNNAPGEEFSLDGLESVTLKSLNGARSPLSGQTYPVMFTFPDGRKQSIVINVEGFPFITSSNEVAVAHYKQFSLSSASPVAVGSIVHVKGTPASVNYVVVKQVSARSIFVRSVEPVNGATVMTIVSVEDVEPAQPKLPFGEERAAFCRAISACVGQGFLNTNGQMDKFIEEVSHDIDENLKVLLRTVSPSATDLATLEFPRYGLKVTLTYDGGSVFPALIEERTESLPQRFTESACQLADGRADITRIFLAATL